MGIVQSVMAAVPNRRFSVAGTVAFALAAAAVAKKVGMEDFTATRPSAVIVLDLEVEADVLNRVSGRRVDMATGEASF